MLAHKLKGGVSVVREYAELPPIDAYAGELNQVWTNLIDNAVDAMDGQGTLDGATPRPRASGSSWRSPTPAPGCRPTWRPGRSSRSSRTKDVGQGTGLGLDIARRIVVERHGGLIEIDSPAHEGKGTVMRVRLPREARD